MLAFREKENHLKISHTEVLSKKGDMREAAANLFAAIRRLDALNLDLILAGAIPEIGLAGPSWTGCAGRGTRFADSSPIRVTVQMVILRSEGKNLVQNNEKDHLSSSFFFLFFAFRLPLSFDCPLKMFSW